MQNKLLKNFLTYIFFLTYFVTFGQVSIPDEYYTLVKKADSLYKIKDYKSSALVYSSAFAANGWKGLLNDRYNAACSWALSGNKDSAFFPVFRNAAP